MTNEAFVTLATSDQYALGALVLAKSIQNVGTSKKFIIMISNDLSPLLKKTLENVFDEVILVDQLNSNDEKNLQLLSRPELGITYTKINCWLLEKYSKCVFLDADILVLKNIDDLFQREEFSAAPDAGWPDCFNSGVFVYRPSKETYRNLMLFSNQDNASFDGGDQGLLNQYYSDWNQSDRSRHLPFTYNVTSNTFYSYLPAVTRFQDNIHIVHFAGAFKPWQLTFNTENEQLSGNVPSQNNIQRDFILRWWRICSQQVLPEINSNRSLSDIDNQTNYSEQDSLTKTVSFNFGQIRTDSDTFVGSPAHRRAWESGHVDYQGRDSFSNIQQTIENKIAQQGKTPYHPSNTNYQREIDSIVTKVPVVTTSRPIKSDIVRTSIEKENEKIPETVPMTRIVQPMKTTETLNETSKITTQSTMDIQPKSTSQQSIETINKVTEKPLEVKETKTFSTAEKSNDQMKTLESTTKSTVIIETKAFPSTDSQMKTDKELSTQSINSTKLISEKPLQSTQTIHSDQSTILPKTTEETSNGSKNSTKSTVIIETKSIPTVVSKPSIESISTIRERPFLPPTSDHVESLSVIPQSMREPTNISIKSTKTTTVIETQSTSSGITQTTIEKENPSKLSETMKIHQDNTLSTTGLTGYAAVLSNIPSTFNTTDFSTLSKPIEETDNTMKTSTASTTIIDTKATPINVTQTAVEVNNQLKPLETSNTFERILKTPTKMIDSTVPVVPMDTSSTNPEQNQWKIKSTVTTAFTSGIGELAGPTIIRKTVSETSSGEPSLITSVKETTKETTSTVKQSNDYSAWLFDKFFLAITYTISLCYLFFLFAFRRYKSSRMIHGQNTTTETIKTISESNDNSQMKKSIR